jgi:hypothetical protein
MCKTILILALSVLSAHAGLNKLEAISMIETGNNDAAVGEAGEVSRYQIMPRIWRKYTSSRAYQDKQLSAWVADQYLAALEATFRTRTGREPDDFDRYVLWNAGPVYYERIGFSAARVHPIIRERANRFVNLREMGQPAKSQAQSSVFAANSAASQGNLRQTLSLPATEIGLGAISWPGAQGGIPRHN